jgi:two-component system sensor histidine kinase DesK
MIVREAVTNIHRHARATRAEARVAVRGRALELMVTDDGRGGVRAFGNGLSGMRERVAALGGALSLESPRGAGTRIVVSVPLAAMAPSRAGAAGDPRRAA